MSTTKTLAKGTAWGLFAAFLLKFLGWFYWIILARMVSQAEIGVFSSALSLMSVIILFSDLGLGSGSVGRYVPTYCGKGLYNHVKKVLKVSLATGIISSIVFMAVIFLVSGFISDFYHTERVVPVFQIMAFYIIFYNLYMIASSFLGGRKLIKLVSYTSSAQGLFKLLFTVLFVLAFGPTAENIAIGFVLSYAVAGLLGWIWTLKAYKNLPASKDDIPNFKLFCEMVPFGLTIVVLTSMYLLNSQFDSIMLGHLLPSNINMQMVGVYALIASFATVTNIFANSIGSMFHPIINELWAQKKTWEMEKVSSDYLRWIAILTMPVMVLIFAFSFELLTVMYGAGYGIGALAFIFYSTGLFIYSFSYPIQNTLSGMRRLDVTIKIVLAGLFANIILNIALIPNYGIDGSAFASMISFAIMTVLFIRIRKTTFLKIPKDIHKPFLAGILSLGVLLIVKYLTSGFGFSSLDYATSDAAADLGRKALKLSFLAIISGMTSITYLLFLVALKSLHKEDVDIVAGGLRRFKVPAGIIAFASKLLLRE